MNKTLISSISDICTYNCLNLYRRDKERLIAHKITYNTGFPLIGINKFDTNIPTDYKMEI